jgi:hypothetical protein
MGFFRYATGPTVPDRDERYQPPSYQDYLTGPPPDDTPLPQNEGNGERIVFVVPYTHYEVWIGVLNGPTRAEAELEGTLDEVLAWARALDVDRRLVYSPEVDDLVPFE